MTLKCDNEVALLAVRAKAAELMRTEAVMEEPTEGDKQANGVIEQANLAIESQLGTLIDELGRHIEEELNATDHITKWAARHAAYIKTRFQVGADGKTPYERWKGKAFRQPLLEFGEVCMYWHGNGGEKLKPKWSEGLWIGKSDRSTSTS